jgi:hypothetical protein
VSISSQIADVTGIATFAESVYSRKKKYTERKEKRRMMGEKRGTENPKSDGRRTTRNNA